MYVYASCMCKWQKGHWILWKWHHEQMPWVLETAPRSLDKRSVLLSLNHVPSPFLSLLVLPLISKKKTVIVILVCHRRLLHWDILPLCLDYKGFYHVKMLGLSSDYFGNHWIGSWIHLCGELCLLTYACRTFLHHWNETNFIINLNQDWICIPKYSLQVLCWKFLCLCLPVRLACQSTFLWSFIWFY